MADNQRPRSRREKGLVSGEEYVARKNEQYSAYSEYNRQYQQQFQPQDQPKEKKPFSFRSVFLLCCTGVFIFSAYHLISYFVEIGQSKKSTDNLRQIYVSTQTETPLSEDMGSVSASSVQATEAVPAMTPVPAASATEQPKAFREHWPQYYANNPNLVLDEGFQTLRQENRDIVGWIKIEGVLDEPVLQRDNSFYLTHDASGKSNVTGALFLDENCNLRQISHNFLIHGHNMKEGAMFGVLKKYKLKDASFYKENPFIQFNTLYEEATYVIFAVTEISLTPGDHYYLPFWLYLNFETERDFNAYITHLKEYSHFQTSVDVVPGDRLLTLATCSGTDNAGRLLVVARKVRDGENLIDLKQGIFSTTVK